MVILDLVVAKHYWNYMLTQGTNMCAQQADADKGYGSGPQARNERIIQQGYEIHS